MTPWRSLRLDDVPVGTRVRVSAWGLGARMIDIGRTGQVVRHGRVRAVVDLDPGNGEPRQIRHIDPMALHLD